MTPDGKICVLHMGLDDRKGGIESFLYNMTSNLDWDRFQFDFLCYGKDPAYGEELKAMGARLILLPDRHDLTAYKKMINQTLSQRYDFLHLHKNSPIDFLPAVWADKAGVRVVIHSHNGPHKLNIVDSFLASLGRRVLDRHTCLRLACSRKAGEWLFGKSADFAVFPNAIRLSDYTFDPETREKVREELGISTDAFVVGIVGRLVAQKNYPFMIRTFARLHAEVPETHLVIAGEGELRDEIGGFARDLGVGDLVMLLGRRDDVSDMYSAFDCACCPSIYEGFSFFTLESLAAGLPCLVSEAVPPEARITSLVEVLNLDEGLWAEKLAAMAHSGRQRTALAEVDLAAMDKFDIASAAERLMAIYEKLLVYNGKDR